MSNNKYTTEYGIDRIGIHVVSSLVKPTDDVPDIDLDHLIGILDSLPSYTEFQLEWVEGTRTFEPVLMARDIPRPGRRYTCLSSGTEWLDMASILANHEGLVLRDRASKPIVQVMAP